MYICCMTLTNLLDQVTVRATKSWQISLNLDYTLKVMLALTSEVMLPTGVMKPSYVQCVCVCVCVRVRSPQRPTRTHEFSPQCTFPTMYRWYVQVCVRCNNPSRHTDFRLIVAVLYAQKTLYTVQGRNCKRHLTTFAKMLVYSALYNVNEKKNILRESKSSAWCR